MHVSDLQHDVCFVALSAYGVLAGRDDLTHLGGAEVQQVLLARELVRRSYRVCFVTKDHGQPDGIQHDGIRVFKAYDEHAGMRKLRLIYPWATGLWQALRRADAHVYYQRLAEWTTGVVGLYCRRHARRFVYAVASDFHCFPDLPTLSRVERFMYKVGLRRADAVIAQSEGQREMLQRHYGRSSVVLHNAGPEPVSTEHRGGSIPRRVLWLGRFSPEKRLEMIFELASKLPDVTFDIVGGAVPATDYSRRMVEAASRHANVVLHGIQPHESALRLYEQVGIVLCTSIREGFPNTYLEAWSRGIPVVCTFDPDGLVESHDLGVIGHDCSGMYQGCIRLLNDSCEWRRYSDRIRQYYVRHHTANRVVDQLSHVLQLAPSGEE